MNNESKTKSNNLESFTSISSENSKKQNNATLIMICITKKMMEKVKALMIGLGTYNL